MNNTFPYNYIVVEGNIGSGKTTFCEKIAAESSCNLILEEFDDNPFLPMFYKNPEQFAFTVELFFMTERYKQLEKYLVNRNIFDSFTLADYAFVKTLLFARHNLAESEYKMFTQMFRVLDQAFPKPDIIFYFHRSVDYLLRSIAKRGREYEKDIKKEYLERVQNSYFDYFKNEFEVPIVIIDLKDIDFKDNDVNYQYVKDIMSKSYRPGVHSVALSV